MKALTQLIKRRNHAKRQLQRAIDEDAPDEDVDFWRGYLDAMREAVLLTMSAIADDERKALKKGRE